MTVLEKGQITNSGAVQGSEYFISSLEQSPFGAQVLSLDGRLRYANQAMLAIWGYASFEELASIPVERRYSDKSLDLIKRLVGAFGGGATLGAHELCILRKDGSTRDVLAYGSACVWEGETCNLMQYQDITEFKRADIALRHSEGELRHIFQSVAEGIIVTSLNGTITKVNDALILMLGLSARDQVIGRFISDFVTCNAWKSSRRSVKNWIRCPRLRRGIELMRSNGTRLAVEITYGVLKDSVGHPTGAVITVKDVTEARELQRHIEAQDRLAMIGELVSGVAHEINNPLTSVMGFAQLLAEQDLPSDTKKDIELIRSEAERAVRIVKGLLTFARKHPPAKQPSSINAIIEEVLKLRAYEQRVDNIEVIADLSPGLPEIMLDYHQMQQVFLNLVINAEYFMLEARKKGTLTVTTELAGGFIRAKVSDDGPGIPSENLNRVFDPFFTTKGVGKGTGLGLSICHGIIAEHGGRVFALSEGGKGATFVIELPLHSPTVGQTACSL